MNHYIQGNKDKADEIKAAFEKLGYKGTYSFDAETTLYFTFNGAIKTATADSYISIIKTHPDYKELELPKPHYDIKNFKPGMPVLVRDNKDQEWGYTTFSHISSRFDISKFEAGCTCWIQCIPFEGNEHLLGTTDMCDEMYINW